MTSIWHPWAFFPFGLGALFAWGIWLYRRTVAHRVGPIGGDFRTSVSVVVPVYGEDPALLSDCLDTWLAEDPDELILVVDTGDVECAAMLRSRDLGSSVRIISFTHRGKRSALGVGIRAATGEVLILCDSDTAWTPGLVAEVMKPFADPRVGGVGTRQLAAARETSIWRRIVSWVIDVRFLDYTPALGSRGCVPVLSGRTAAYRRALVAPVVEQLEHEVFLGRECVAGEVQAGHMALRTVRATHLGFATGSTSGVAWMQRLGIPSTGGATDSTFAHNLYGVYSSGASGLRFLRDRFVHNRVYGFDPHGAPPGEGTNEALGTNDTLVSDSIAAYNGRHGFIFSSGCHRNVVRNSISRFNGGNGFVIDDGRPRGTLVNPSNDNTLRNVVATRNGGTGVVIEGGRDNALVSSRVDTNRAGVRISDRARNAVVSNTAVVNTLWTAISISEGSTAYVDSVTVNAAAVGVRSTGISSVTGIVVQNAAVAGYQLQPTDRVIRASITGTGARTVDGIHSVDASDWTTTMPASSGHVRLLSTTRHQVWILLFLIPLVLWSGARLIHFVRNLTTRTGL